MFSEIGKKIRKLAVILAWVSIIGGVCWSIYGFTEYNENKKYIEYATFNGGFLSDYSILTEAGNRAYFGRINMITGIVVAVVGFVGSWPLYGFGELIVQTTELNDKQSVILSKLVDSYNSGGSDFELPDL